MQVREIDVRRGDVFYHGLNAFVVERVMGGKAYGRTTKGRSTAISAWRLQTEFMRLGTNKAEAAHKKLATIDRRKVGATRGKG